MEGLPKQETSKEENKGERVKIGGFESPDRLSIKKWEEMTPQEQEEQREFERKNLGVRQSGI